MTESVRIAIIGSGPAGLSAAARAAQLGISHVLLEKTDHLSDTIYRYQKGKHVMATPSQLVLRADLDFEAGKREQILDVWNTQAAAHQINVRLNAEVTAIASAEAKDAAPYRLTLKDGSELIAETVILAIGTQGNPNQMRCEGADLPHVQYTLDDPKAHIDEHIFVVGTGDAGIENAMGTAEDAEQRNNVTIVNRGGEFAAAKDANVKGLMSARDAGRLNIQTFSETSKIEEGWITLETRNGQERFRCDRVIARIGSTPPRKFLEQCGIQFASEDRQAFPTLTESFESTASGIFVIGALAGYPLIKHCLNQGHDVVEFINGNRDLKPADEPILAEKFAGLPGNRDVSGWLEFLRTEISILNGMNALQMREFMLDSEARFYTKGETIFERNAPGSSLFAIAQGSVAVLIDPRDDSKRVPIGCGSIFGEVGLISGRKRGATIVAAEDAICVEISRNAALKLQGAVPAAKRAIERISIERQLLQMFGSGLGPADLAEIVDSYEIATVPAGQAVMTEGEEGNDLYAIRQGSLVIEREIAGKTVFLSYLPAGSYIGEIALVNGGKRTATARAAIKTEVIKLQGAAFMRLLDRKPELRAKLETEMASRQELNKFVAAKKDSFSGVVDMYSGIAGFLVENGIGEATDVLLIDENLCVGCNNCEKACADSHDGLSRLDRQAGKSYAHLHVPTSCRHCEHPACMSDCPANAIRRGPDGEVVISDGCIGCGNCQLNCPYGVIRMAAPPPKKPHLVNWLLFGAGPGPGEPSKAWSYKKAKPGPEIAKKAIKCDMCTGRASGPACVSACPTGAALRVSPEKFLSVASMTEQS